ncbi:hypothetical protein JQT66_01295 [Sulfitobacter mediterraneus]|uniref:hypothetical protein n=1 Tax=Sulfitobacter mediterraneus TaxID=83219 RepID=UPI0019332BF5|nr:hypothetical protein [Sulfitobacter mediterraneus]MBM1308795.1 hypothetical protein [Sulfitobacter mediterraneus]MBM1312680.1 hypothetical protein [Sulfitobacter mediterraneus]MBM1321062.1 hypothetical protein [Sulfitobacter mediterraneus]MBM1324949.1 hypothetical protein [Sulfitobacter mediterraneus]MBM1396296.1 hypothetical protein [Sulfitobacter mediterraneus]
MIGLAFVVASWIMLALNLFRALPSADVALVLGTIAIAESVALLLASHRKKKTLQQELEISLARWTSLVLFILLAGWYGELPFFQDQPLALLCFLGLSLCISLLRLIQTQMQSASALWCSSPVRIWVCAMICPAISLGAEPNQTVVLFAAVLVALVLLGLALVGGGSTPAKVAGGKSTSEVSSSLMSQMDLLILPILLNPTLTWPYLIARGVGTLPQLVLSLLHITAELRLVEEREEGGIVRLAATAGRINLGSLLIGGASFLMVLAIVPLVAQHFHLPETDFKSIALWITFAHFAPAFLGATVILLRTAGMRRELLCIQISCSVLFCCTLLFGSETSGLEIAKTLAATSWLASFLGAALLAKRYGIWPGITAVLFRQIRLF